jgi:cytoskeletal protein RodZ
MQIGTTLRDARLSRNLTLHDISRVTKIPVRLLESIDRDDLAAIPGDFFARAFLRAYAAEVGLDPAQIVGDYVKQLPLAAVPLAEPPAATASPIYVLRLVLALAVCVITALGAWGFVHAYQRQSRNSAPSASSPAAQLTGVSSTETSDAAPVSTPPDRPGESLGPPVTAWPSKPGESETSGSDGDNGRPPQFKPAPRERVQARKPAGNDSSEPPPTEMSNQPIKQRPVEATAAIPPDEPDPNQGRIQ